MDESKKKILLIIFSCLAMMVFVFFAFIRGKTIKNDTSGYINPASLDRNPSKLDSYAQKRKREHLELSENRNVNSLESYLDNPIIKDPFTDSISFTKSDSQKTITEEKPVVKEKIIYIARDAEKDKIEPAKQNPDIKRKTGFASGGNDEMAQQTTSVSSTNIKALAVVQDNVSVKSGSNIKLRILEPFKVGSIDIPENTFVIGRTLLSNDHIYIDVNSISANGKLLPVKLSAFDLNGSKGIYVEGGTDKEIKTDVLDEAVNEVQKNVNIPILKDIPFSATKKKISEPEVLVTAGLKIYLINQ